jgi:hypothetical protein
MTGKRPESARARTVLVFGDDSAATAVVADVAVRVREPIGSDRVFFTGPVAFEASVVTHIRSILVPLVDRVMAGLGMKAVGFEIVVVNPAGVSVHDLATRITGFSADAALVLALLSAGLGILPADDVVCTGHVASIDGHFRPVRSLPAKLQAAAADKRIARFIYPNLDLDPSLAGLSPAAHQQAAEAIALAPTRLATRAVADIAALVEAVFEDEAIVLASLQRDFFETSAEANAGHEPVGRILDYLGRDNEERFWRVLERRMLEGPVARVHELLDVRVGYQLRRRRYPTGVGARLWQLVRSLPPSAARRRGLFPLLPANRCAQVGRYAKATDNDDLERLTAAVVRPVQRRQGRRTPAARKPSTRVSAQTSLANLLAQLDAGSLAETVGLPIDSARARYVVDTVTVTSYDEFLHSISAFYLHVMRHLGQTASPDRAEVYGAEVIALLERAFRQRGGLEAAYAEAGDGAHGGMRRILDLLTEQLKSEAKAKQVRRVLKEAIDPLDWSSRVALMAALLERLGPALPADLRARPPERFARRWEELVEAYVDSLDRIQQALRSV